jgi:hypothetical protein
MNQVDEKRNPKTRATVDQLIAKYFEVLDVDTQTMRGYRSKYKNHIKPWIGSQPLTRLDIEILDSFYAQLRTCRDHCRGRTYIQHRTDRPHQCDVSPQAARSPAGIGSREWPHRRRRWSTGAWSTT